MFRGGSWGSMITLDQVSKRYKEVIALQQLSVSFSAPGVHILVGPSGSGKTTLLRLIAGLDIPDEGTITFGGKLASRSGSVIIPPYERNLGFVFQTSALWPHMTVAQNVLFGLHRLPKKDAHLRLREVLALTGSEEFAHRLPSEISVGQARRVALARAIAPSPRYLLMDEPLTSLDGESRHTLMECIKNLVSQSSTPLIYVTHDMQEAHFFEGTILRMDSGKIVQD